MKKNYILLDVNGTIGTDEPPFLENLLNPENFVWIEKVQAHVNLSTLYRIKEMAEKYFSEKGVFDLKEYGISYFVSFGYRDEDITPKTRRELSEVYEVAE